MTTDELIEKAAKAIKPLFDDYCTDFDAEDHAWEAAQAAFAVFEQAQAEPEWEWALMADGDDEPWSNYYDSRELLADNLDGLAARDDEHLVRRRKAGPWKPVEATDE